MTPRACWCLIRGVFRQARASGLTAVLLTVTLLATGICATAEFVESSPASGLLNLLFGSLNPVSESSRPEAVRQLEFLLAGGVAGNFGVLLALVWTAGFLPASLEPSAASVLLAKPPSRAGFLIGWFLGVCLYVTAQAGLFILGTWVALGLRTGVWPAEYWFGVPILLGHFAVFFSFSAFLAVVTHSTMTCMAGSILFWLTCWGVNYGRHALAGIRPEEATPAAGQLSELGYWLLPKPIDFGLMLGRALGDTAADLPLIGLQALQAQDVFHPAGSLASSIAFAVVMLGLAVHELNHTDY